ncbi:MAG: amino acid ABC transporter substrate-binding protein [Spirochaetales bacterium]|jgi:polar amino acid transport system substrate-binding protein|nr:amino acid ABC transporter substrate-binding protein [Spirochaetales bacterium]
MKKMVVFLCCLLAAAGVVYAAGGKEAAGGDDSLNKIIEKKKFVLGLDDSFPPMGFRDENNEIVGYDVDLAKEVARRVGVELVLQPIDWNAKEQELNTGEIDCIWNGFTITPERAKALTFSKPYLKNAQVVVVRANSGYKTLDSLSGKIAGIQAGSSAAEALDSAVEFKASLKDVVEYKENLTALMDLEVSGIDAVIMDLIVANDAIKRSGKNFLILEESLAPEEYGIGFRKADIALRNKVQEVLEAMAADGTAAKISTKWLGADISIIGK